MLFLNTRKDRFEKIRDRTRELHSYELPEIIAVPILSGSSDFFNWIKENTR
jgi:periplasmic divalent cation tolerance protein